VLGYFRPSLRDRVHKWSSRADCEDLLQLPLDGVWLILLRSERK
jgi:hypothetical protein